MTRQEWLDFAQQEDLCKDRLAGLRLSKIENIRAGARLVRIQIFHDKSGFNIAPYDYVVVSFSHDSGVPKIIFSTENDGRWSNPRHSFVDVIGEEMYELIFLVRT